MPQSTKDLVGQVTKANYANSTTSMLNHALQISSAQEPVIADDEQKADLIAATLAVFQVPSGLLKSGCNAILGAVLLLVPKTKLSTDTLEVQFNEQSNPGSDGFIKTSMTNRSLVKREGVGLLHYERHAVRTNIEDGTEEVLEPISENRLTRVGMPWDKSPKVVDYSKKHSPTFYTKSNNEIGGVHLMISAGHEAINTVKSAVSGAATLLAFGAQKIDKLVRRGPGK